MPNDDLIYLLRRAVEERQRADGCDHAAARAAHEGLAEGYEDRVRRGSQHKVAPIGAK